MYAELKEYAIRITGLLLVAGGILTYLADWYSQRPDKIFTDNVIILVSYGIDIAISALIGFYWGAVYWEKKREKIKSEAATETS
jgi:hypothetical protein